MPYRPRKAIVRDVHVSVIFSPHVEYVCTYTMSNYHGNVHGYLACHYLFYFKGFSHDRALIYPYLPIRSSQRQRVPTMLIGRVRRVLYFLPYLYLV